jgi:hypothetical protein
MDRPLSISHGTRRGIARLRSRRRSRCVQGNKKRLYSMTQKFLDVVIK